MNLARIDEYAAGYVEEEDKVIGDGFKVPGKTWNKLYKRVLS